MENSVIYFRIMASILIIVSYTSSAQADSDDFDHHHHGNHDMHHPYGHPGMQPSYGHPGHGTMNNDHIKDQVEAQFKMMYPGARHEQWEAYWHNYKMQHGIH